jgi:hypothetical protein
MLQTSRRDRHQRAARVYVRCEDNNINGRAMSSWRSDGYDRCM